MIATNVGLGYMLFVARDFYRTEVIVLGMIVIGVLWLLIDRLLLAPLERATIERWGMVQPRMTTSCCRSWSAYVRLTARWPALASIVPFIPVVALWSAVAESGVFPRVFLPGPPDVVRSFVDLDLQGHPARLSAGQHGAPRRGRGLGHGARHSARHPDRHEPAGRTARCGRSCCSSRPSATSPGCRSC